MNSTEDFNASIDGAMWRPVGPPRLELFWYDRIVRSLTRRAPQLMARMIMRAHRFFVGERLTPIQLSDFRMAVSPQDNCGHHLFYYGEYEPLQVELWNELLSRGREITVIDIGANIGYYSLLAARRSNVRRVLSFEPNPLVLPTLRQNALLNPRFAEKIQILEMAVGEVNGTVQFHRNFEAHNFGLGSMRAQSADEYTVEVPMVCLDSYLKLNGVNQIDLIKIDVEGAEQLVLSGFEGWLRANSRPTMVIEVHPKNLADFGSSVGALFATLTRAGYKLQKLREDGELETASSHFNAICWVVAEPYGA